jgi:glycine cleavage system H lipoate-binding protein
VVEHPIKIVDLNENAEENLDLVTSNNRDSKEYGWLISLSMKNEKDISYLNFYQDLRNLSVLSGAKR